MTKSSWSYKKERLRPGASTIAAFCNIWAPCHAKERLFSNLVPGPPARLHAQLLSMPCRQLLSKGPAHSSHCWGVASTSFHWKRNSQAFTASLFLFKEESSHHMYIKWVRSQWTSSLWCICCVTATGSTDRLLATGSLMAFDTAFLTVRSVHLNTLWNVFWVKVWRWQSSQYAGKGR